MKTLERGMAVSSMEEDGVQSSVGSSKGRRGRFACIIIMVNKVTSSAQNEEAELGPKVQDSLFLFHSKAYTGPPLHLWGPKEITTVLSQLQDGLQWEVWRHVLSMSSDSSGILRSL